MHKLHDEFLKCQATFSEREVELLNKYKCNPTINDIIHYPYLTLNDLVLAFDGLTQDECGGKSVNTGLSFKDLLLEVWNQHISQYNIGLMDSIFKKAPKLKGRHTLYRGIQLDEKQALTNKQYLSTSLRLDTALNFTNRSAPIVFVFKKNKGLPYVYLEGPSKNFKEDSVIGKFGLEYEILLQRGLVFKVVGREVKKMPNPYFERDKRNPILKVKLITVEVSRISKELTDITNPSRIMLHTK